MFALNIFYILKQNHAVFSLEDLLPVLLIITRAFLIEHVPFPDQLPHSEQVSWFPLCTHRDLILWRVHIAGDIWHLSSGPFSFLNGEQLSVVPVMGLRRVLERRRGCCICNGSLNGCTLILKETCRGFHLQVSLWNQLFQAGIFHRCLCWCGNTQSTIKILEIDFFLKIANNNFVAKDNSVFLQLQLANGNSQVTHAREILFL